MSSIVRCRFASFWLIFWSSRRFLFWAPDSLPILSNYSYLNSDTIFLNDSWMIWMNDRFDGELSSARTLPRARNAIFKRRSKWGNWLLCQIMRAHNWHNLGRAHWQHVQSTPNNHHIKKRCKIVLLTWFVMGAPPTFFNHSQRALFTLFNNSKWAPPTQSIMHETVKCSLKNV